MTRFLLLSLAIGVASTSAAEPTLFTPAPTFSGPHPAVVRVVVPERDGTTYGSGALVAVGDSSGLVVTNWHVVRDAAGPIMVFFPDGFRSPASVLRTDRDWDLAALAIWRPSAQPILLSSEAPRPGEPLTIAGYGSGSYRAVTGRCTQYVSPGGNQPFEMIEISAPARNGDSGGPILNQRGELAGVLFGSAFGRTAGSYCGRLRWFLTSVDGDFRRVSSQMLLAQQSRRNPPPLAAINSAGSPVGQESTSSSSLLTEGPGVRATPASCTSRVSPVPTLPTATDPVRTTAAPVASLPTPPINPLPSTDQIRTILAAVGVIAVLYHALRLLGAAVG